MLIAIGFLVMLGAISVMAHRRADVITRYDSKTTKTLAKVVAVFSFGAALVLAIPFVLSQFGIQENDGRGEVLEQEFPNTFVAQRENSVSQLSIGGSSIVNDTPLVYVLPDHSGLLVQVIGSSNQIPEIGEVFVDTQN